MPFEPSKTLDPNPSVRIFFIGLNILAATEDKKCQVYVHKTSPPHTLSIEVRRKRKGKPDVLMMRHLGKLNAVGLDPNNGFLIHTNLGEGEETGVKAYNGYEASPEGTKLGDAFSLKKLLGITPDIDPKGALPGISINHGIFYTADKFTGRAKIKKNDGTVTELTEVPTILGANIYLSPGNDEHQVTLIWRQQGDDVHLSLTPSEDSSYEIYVVNEPLFVPDGPSPLTHGEFTEYFKIIRNVPRNQQFEIEFIDVPERGSNRTPCTSIVLDDNDAG